jgi:hypothetical protein
MKINLFRIILIGLLLGGFHPAFCETTDEALQKYEKKMKDVELFSLEAFSMGKAIANRYGIAIIPVIIKRHQSTDEILYLNIIAHLPIHETTQELSKFLASKDENEKYYARSMLVTFRSYISSQLKDLNRIIHKEFNPDADSETKK